MSNVELLKSDELVNHVITSDYLGMADQKDSLVELLIRIKTGSLTVEDLITLVRNRKCHL